MMQAYYQSKRGDLAMTQSGYWLCGEARLLEERTEFSKHIGADLPAKTLEALQAQKCQTGNKLLSVAHLGAGCQAHLAKGR